MPFCFFGYDTHMESEDLVVEAQRLQEEAESLLRAGNPDEALRRLSFALDSLRGKRNPRAEAGVLETLALAHRATGNMEKAELSTRAALACWMKVEDRAEEARVLGLLASLRISQGALEDGEFWLTSSLPVLRESNNRSGEADILRSLSTLYLRKGQLTKAEDYAVQAIELFRELGDKVGEARTQGTYAQMLVRRTAFTEAHAAAERCQQLFEEAGHKQGVTSGMQVRSAIMRREGRLNDAETLLGEIIKQKREMKDVAGEAGAMNTLGLAVLDSGDARWNEAERHLLRAIELFASVNDSQNAALSQQNLADLYVLRGRAADAELVLRDALKIHRRTGGIESQARSLNALATTLCAQDRIDEGLEHFEESVALARQVNNTSLVIRMLCPLAEIRLLLCELGEDWAALAGEVANEKPDADVMLRLVLPLSIRVALVQEDLPGAKSLLEEAQQALDSEPESMRGVLGKSVAKARQAFEGAQSGQPLYQGFLPTEIDTELRNALIKYVKESNPDAYQSLDDAVVEAMEA